MKFQKEFEVALEAVRRASRLCRSVQANLPGGPMKKEDRSPVTVADFGSQALVCLSLGDVFPDDPIIAEEDATALRTTENRLSLERVMSEVGAIVGDVVEEDVCSWIDRGNAGRFSDRFWTLDPIDGTKGFLRGEQYAVALALVVEGELAVAALACPNLDYSFGTDAAKGSIYAAARGEGAWCYEIDGPRSQRIEVSQRTDASESRFCESVESAHSSHADSAAIAELLGIVREPFRLDSQAKYAVVARGDAEIYLRLTKRTGYVEQIWDHAAGALVVQEAGGTVTDLNGLPLDFRQGTRLARNVGIVATNGRLHDQVLTALADVLVSN